MDQPVEVPGAATGAIRSWLRIEGLLVLILATLLYARLEYSWAVFAILFLAPDVSFAGYLAGPRAGAAAYNLLHSHAGPLLLGVGLLWTGHSLAVPLIWVAHVGLDRALGYGLKYPTRFSHTHLGRIGR